MHWKKLDSVQLELDQCQSGNQDGVITRKELDLCRNELKEEQNSKEQVSRNLQSANGNIRALQSQLNSKNAENENLRNRIRQLENENDRIQSESSQNQLEMTDKVRGQTNENRNLQKTLEMFQRKPIVDCEGPIVENNGFSLLKKPSEIQVCQDHGIYDEPENSILMFYSYAEDGNNEIAVITRGLSNYLDKTDQSFHGGYKIGNKDKIITSFNTNGNVKYQFKGACGVTYKGLIHFFGGGYQSDYGNQHFGFDEKRNFVKYQNLGIYFWNPQCSTFKISKPNSRSGDKEVVLICFDYNHKKNCYQYDDGELTQFADANENHLKARLGKHKDQLITVGGSNNQKTEILDRSYNGEYKWTLGPNYNFSPTPGKIYGQISSYSMVNVPLMGFNEEYLLLIGGQTNGYPRSDFSDKVHKYNGKWSFFGNLQKTRYYHNSIFLNGRVFIIGGYEKYNKRWMKTETWDSSKSQFETESTWPELNDWESYSNHVFVIPGYTNP